jgi:hypothetical protein
MSIQVNTPFWEKGVEKKNDMKEEGKEKCLKIKRNSG